MNFTRQKVKIIALMVGVIFSRNILCMNDLEQIMQAKLDNNPKPFYRCQNYIDMFGSRVALKKFIHNVAYLYDKGYGDILKSNYYGQTTRIPKIIHQIWIGKKPFPERYKKWQATWKRMAAERGWKYVLWDDQAVEALTLKNKYLYDAASNFAEKSDILRYEIIFRYGGVYVDTDTECINPDAIESLCREFDFFAGLEGGCEVIIGNAVFASVPQHPFFSFMIDALPSWAYVCDIRKYQNIKWKNNTTMTLIKTSPNFFTALFGAYLGKNGENNFRDIILPPKFFHTHDSVIIRHYCCGNWGHIEDVHASKNNGGS